MYGHFVIDWQVEEDFFGSNDLRLQAQVYVTKQVAHMAFDMIDVTVSVKHEGISSKVPLMVAGLGDGGKRGRRSGGTESRGRSRTTVTLERLRVNYWRHGRGVVAETLWRQR